MMDMMLYCVCELFSRMVPHCDSQLFVGTVLYCVGEFSWAWYYIVMGSYLLVCRGIVMGGLSAGTVQHCDRKLSAGRVL